MATYTKLKSGEWGVRMEGGTPKAGEQVTVSTRAGKTKTERIARVLWTDGQTAICGIEQGSSSSSSSSRSKGKGPVCAECGKPGRLVSDLEDGLLKHYRCCDIPPNGY